MNRRRVWAPLARTIHLESDGLAIPMSPEGGGWFGADAPSPTAPYRFVVDGDPLPDPRSASQPEGVRGPSQPVDHAAFPWTDAAWSGIHLPSAIIYELHVGTFSPEGTFDGVIHRLDHLVGLGVNAIEIMPVNEFPGRWGWGYDGVLLYAPHHAYGGPDGLKRLVDACHARGVGVLLDVVYNHLGPSGNHLARFGPYFTPKYSTPWGQAVNVDGPDSDEVRAFFCENALMWLHDYHLDGLRLDAVGAIIDTSAVHILEELTERVDALAAHLGHGLVLVAESDRNDPRVVTPRPAGGYGVNAQWSDDFHHALHVALTGERDGYYVDFGDLADIGTALRQAFVYDGRYSAFRRRRHGRVPRGLSGHNFLGYMQNHDQIGNRAVGERSSALMSSGRLHVAAALVLTSPFIPLLFQGEEWAASTPFQFFTDHDDPDLARAVREGRQQEFAAFGWDPGRVPDPQDPETFSRSCLDWEERARSPHRELEQWHRDLIALRRRHAELTDGRFDLVSADVDEEARWLVVTRGDVTVACNLGPAPQAVPVANLSGRAITLASERSARLGDGVVHLAPDSVAILTSAPEE